MKSITVRKLKIGEGIPKICVPIVGKTSEEILKQAEGMRTLPVDLVEWRCDWYEQAHNHELILEMLRKLRAILGEMPLLFTFRTADEGGKKATSTEMYVSLNKLVITTGYADLVDVQLFLGDDILQDIVEYAHSHGSRVVASNHDFNMTPSREELIQRLHRMQDLGADIAKLAVMPQTEEDVRTLLEVTEIVSQREESGPIITVSMSEFGRRSRIEGEIHGSAVTFGSAAEASAPGQIFVKELKVLLENVHDTLVVSV